MYTVVGTLKTRAFRVAWMLEELGLDYTVDPVPPRAAKLAGISPSMKVPVLKDGDAYVTDSVAICQYLADKHGRLTFPAGTIERAHQDSFTLFILDEIEGPLWTAARHRFVLPKELRVEAVKAACKFEFDRAIGHLSARLCDKPYAMGDAFTVPDLIAGHCGGWAKSSGWEISDVRAAAYFDRINARPAAVKVSERRAVGS